MCKEQLKITTVPPPYTLLCRNRKKSQFGRKGTEIAEVTGKTGILPETGKAS